ncbi:MAG: tape measure protein [Clostridia bacterium]|nr:tape measure protein [Clostridia bacterium]
MARDISIAISAKDNFSQAITTMRNANQAFNKDLTGLSSKLDALNKSKITLKVDVDKAKAALRDAEKQFKATGDAADQLKLEMANSNYENARRNFELVSKNAKQAERDILSLTNTVSKSENRAGNGRGGNGILSTLASAGLMQMVGSNLTGAADMFVGSKYGTEAGTMFSNILSSAISGAAMGSLAGPIGTAIGTALGGISGLISGANSIYSNKDETFKSYYQNQYNSIIDTQKATLASGSDIASRREQDRISFSTLLGGNSNASKFLDDIVDFSAKTPFEYDDLTTVSRTLLAYGYKQDELIPLLTKVGDAGSALGMNMEDMKYVATALGRMTTSGKTTLEYLNPLLERGVDVWGYLAEASGKTKAQVQDMVSKGLIPGTEAAKAIADYMGRDFAGNMEKQAQTYAGVLSTLNDAQNQLNNAMGEGYNTNRKNGLKEQIDWLSGESGAEMQDAYKKIGQFKASLENLAEQYQRDAIESVMNGVISDSFANSKQKEALQRLAKEYAAAQADYYDASKFGNEKAMQEAGAIMGRTLAEAQAIAQDEYNASEGAQIALKANKTLAENIKNDAGLREAYWDAGYEMGLQFSKGLASVINPTSQDTTKYPENMDLGTIGRARAYAQNSPVYDMKNQREQAPATSEKQSYEKSPVTVTGNHFYVREEADIGKVAKELARQITQAYTLAQ